MPGGSEEQNQAPVGSGDYEVQQGDCMESIAFKNGFLWQTLWNLPENADLKSQREPNVLLPGDKLTIPPVRLREETGATDQRHKFKLLTRTSRLQLRFLDEEQKPRSGVKYILTIDGVTSNGFLDEKGSLNVPILPNASKGSIRLLTDPDPETYPLEFGNLDPHSTTSGVRARLRNLGFACAAAGDLDQDLRTAIRKYQASRKLQTTGELDDSTMQALKKDHLS